MRVVSNGTAHGTKLFDKNGDELKLDVNSVNLEISSEAQVKATVEIQYPHFDIDIPNNKTIFIMYFAGKLREVDSITFKDGTVWNKDTVL